MLPVELLLRLPSHRRTIWDMPGQDIDIVKTAAAPPSAVWALLDDSASWPSWTPIESHTAVAPPGADGLGEERKFKTGRVTVHELIVERVAQRRLTYTLLGGLAVRDYRAQIDLEPAGEGARIRWHTTFAPKLPGMGWVYRRALEKATRQFVDGLAAEAAR